MKYAVTKVIKSFQLMSLNIAYSFAAAAVVVVVIVVDFFQSNFIEFFSSCLICIYIYIFTTATHQHILWLLHYYPSYWIFWVFE